MKLLSAFRNGDSFMIMAYHLGSRLRSLYVRFLVMLQLRRDVAAYIGKHHEAFSKFFDEDLQAEYKVNIAAEAQDAAGPKS